MLCGVGDVGWRSGAQGRPAWWALAANGAQVGRHLARAHVRRPAVAPLEAHGDYLGGGLRCRAVGVAGGVDAGAGGVELVDGEVAAAAVGVQAARLGQANREVDGDQVGVEVLGVEPAVGQSVVEQGRGARGHGALRSLGGLPSAEPGPSVKAAERSGRSEVEAGGPGAPAPGEGQSAPRRGDRPRLQRGCAACLDAVTASPWCHSPMTVGPGDAQQGNDATAGPQARCGRNEHSPANSRPQ